MAIIDEKKEQEELHNNKLQANKNEQNKTGDASHISPLRLNSYISSIYAGVLGVSEDGRVENLNQAFCDLFNLSESPSSYIGLTSTEMVSKLINAYANPAETLSRMQKIISDAKPLRGEEVAMRDGRFYMVDFIPIIVDGRQHGHIWHHLDITGRKRTEEEMRRQKEELEVLNIEKDKFFSIIAHDLRNPFSAFLGMTKIMAEELPSMTTEQIQKVALSMQRSATNLYNLLDNLLEWSRIERHATGFNPEPCSIKSTVTSCLEHFMDVSAKKEIRVKYDLPQDLTVSADRHMLETLIRNLISNAVKYTHKGGEITISAVINNDHFMEFSVNDTGVGMTKEMITNIFRLDSRNNRPGTEGEPSTGLGLIICKEFIDKHEGKIWVESEEGKGSTMYFTLPAEGSGISKNKVTITG